MRTILYNYIPNEANEAEMIAEYVERLAWARAKDNYGNVSFEKFDNY